MDNPRTINLYNVEPIFGNSPEARLEWQCSILSLLCEMEKSEVVNQLRDFISEATNRVQSSLAPIMDRLCGNIRPYIDRTYLNQVLLPFLVRTLDLTLDLTPPVTVVEITVISKEDLFDSIKQNFIASEADLLDRFEKELQNNEGRISLESFYANIVSDFVEQTYG